MATGSWTLQVERSLRETVERWLGVEDIIAHLKEGRETLDVTFSDVSDAFRFRLQFDEKLLGLRIER